MITVHHLENSRSLRILWLLEELGIPYDIKHYKRDPRTSLAPPELLAIHPLGKAPVITDDGVTLAESGAIIEYLVDRYAATMPNIQRFLGRIHERPAYRRALEKNGKLEILG